MKCEFATKSVADTMVTMIEGGQVNHVPTMTGGVGLKGIRDFYTRFFIPQMPPDTKTPPVSRTIRETQIVDEMILEFNKPLRSWKASFF
jgi:carboxymethylenebutenolidase